MLEDNKLVVRNLDAKRDGENVELFLSCSKPEEDWSIEGKVTYRLVLPDRADGKEKKVPAVFRHGEGSSHALDWNMMVQIATNDSIELDIEVKLLRFTGSAVPEPRVFDARDRDLADVILTVKGEDFYVDKKFLSNHSERFQEIFHSKKGRQQFNLRGIDHRNFLSYLKKF